MHLQPSVTSTLLKGELTHVAIFRAHSFQHAILRSHPTTKIPPNPAPSRRVLKFCPCLIQGDVGGMWKVQRGHKQVHKVTVQTTLVNILCDDLADKIFASARPPV